jgi:hypothetical protein
MSIQTNMPKLSQKYKKILYEQPNKTPKLIFTPHDATQTPARTPRKPKKKCHLPITPIDDSRMQEAAKLVLPWRKRQYIADHHGLIMLINRFWLRRQSATSASCPSPSVCWWRSLWCTWISMLIQVKISWIMFIMIYLNFNNWKGE